MRYFLFLLPVFLQAQSGTPLDQAFRFKEGVFLSHASLLANRPDIAWEDIAGEMVQLTETKRVQIDGFGYHSGEYRRPYAISLDGLAYLFVHDNEKRGYHEFVGLQTPGRYSTIRYDTVTSDRMLMKAYNPANGLAFREGYVERDRQRTLIKIVDMVAGRRLSLTPPAVQRLVAEERDLTEALSKVGNAEEAKLLRALSIYNSRHPMHIPLSAEANR